MVLVVALNLDVTRVSFRGCPTNRGPYVPTRLSFLEAGSRYFYFLGKVVHHSVSRIRHYIQLIIAITHLIRPVLAGRNFSFCEIRTLIYQVLSDLRRHHLNLIRISVLIVN